MNKLDARVLAVLHAASVVSVIGLAALATAAIVVGLLGGNIGAALGAIYAGSVGSPAGPVDSLRKATPLLLAGLSVAVAFRCGIWNIGAEGQFLLGMLGATLAALWLPPLPPLVSVPLCLLSASLFGMLGAALPAYLKLKRDVSEVISTIMLNFLAAFLIQYLVRGPLRDPQSDSDWSRALPDWTRLPPLSRLTGPGGEPLLPRGSELGYLHPGVLIALAVAPLLWLWLARSGFGFRLRAVGHNATAAAAAGLPVTRTLLGAFLLSGGLAGLGGGIEQLAVVARLFPYAPGRPGYGFSGIAVALVGQLHPLGTLASAVFFGTLAAGCDKMQRDAGISYQVGYVIQAAIVLVVIALPGVGLSWITRRFGNSRASGPVTHEDSIRSGDSDGTDVRDAGSTG